MESSKIDFASKNIPINESTNNQNNCDRNTRKESVNSSNSWYSKDSYGQIIQRRQREGSCGPRIRSASATRTPSISSKENVRPKTSCPKEDIFEKDGKKYLRIVTHDHVRDLLIPSQRRNIQADLMHTSEMKKIDHIAHTSKKEEKLKAYEKEENRRRQLKEESDKRVEEFKKFTPEVYIDMETIERENAIDLTSKLIKERALKVLSEEDDEMKTFNSIILGAKCNAIRDAQIVEKKMIEEEKKKEEKKLYELMEIERLKALKLQAEAKVEQKKKRQRFINELKQQLKDNQEIRMLEAEQLMEERVLQSESFQIDQKEIMQTQRKKLEEKEKMKKEMNRVNEHMIKVMEVNKHRERITDLQIQEYTKRKLMEAEEREKERQLQRLLKEQQLVRIREKQKRAMDEKNLKDEIRSLKIQNEVEKAWRKKEKETKAHRSKVASEIVQERNKQIKQKMIQLAIEEEMEKREREKTVKSLKVYEKIEEEEKLQRKKARDELRESLLKQMKEKEEQKKKEKHIELQRNNENQKREQYRENMKRKVMLEKVNEIRSFKVPDKYVSAIERSFFTQPTPQVKTN